jgi:hypothetical protein
VIGDVADSCFWEGVREGLNGRKLDAIKDHTYYAGLHVSYDKNIGDILKTEARFEIAIDPYVKNIPELKGFTLKEESPWISPITGNTIQHWKSDMKLQVFTKD